MLTLSAGSHVMAQSTTQLSDDILEREYRCFVNEIFTHWRDGSQSVFELLTEDAIWTSVGTSQVPGTYHGREEILEKVIRPFGARVSRPLFPTVRGLYADGDTLDVLSDSVAVAKDGHPYESTYSWYLQIRGVWHGQAETTWQYCSYPCAWHSYSTSPRIVAASVPLPLSPRCDPQDRPGCFWVF